MQVSLYSSSGLYNPIISEVMIKMMRYSKKSEFSVGITITRYSKRYVKFKYVTRLLKRKRKICHNFLNVNLLKNNILSIIKYCKSCQRVSIHWKLRQMHYFNVGNSLSASFANSGLTLNKKSILKYIRL